MVTIPKRNAPQSTRKDMPIDSYFTPVTAVPPQSALLTSRATVTQAYTVIPRDVMRESVASYFPHWESTRAWILAKPIDGFSTTFAQYLVEVAGRGGSDTPEPETGVESFLFVLDGTMTLNLDGSSHTLGPGDYAFIPCDTAWSVRGAGSDVLKFHWIRKVFDDAFGVRPAPIVGNERISPRTGEPDDVSWATCLIPIDDPAYDMNVNIVSFRPGAVIPFSETHVMEHGIYVLQGKGVYRLNQDWVEVQEGDFMWLRAFCPQACYASGPGLFRYLLYKDVNRQIRLT
jgi:(S)-ureidoglycine aminohydrolase